MRFPQHIDGRRGEEGFSLVEVILALALFALVSTTVVSGIGGGLASIRKANARQAGTQAANRSVELLRSYPIDSLRHQAEGAGNEWEPTVATSPDFGRVNGAKTHFITEAGVSEELVTSPAGTVPHKDTLTENTTRYAVYTYITWVDHAATTTTTRDYKRVSVIIQWAQNGERRQSEVSTVVTDRIVHKAPPVTAAACSGDTTAPTGSIVINNNDANVEGSAVTLTMSATDACTPISMRVANGSDCSIATLESFSATKAWTLASGPGTQTVCVQFSDGVATPNVSTTYVDTITVIEPPPACPSDVTGPAGSVVIAGGASTTATSAVTLTLAANDLCTPITMSIQNATSCATGGTTEGFSPTKSWPLTPGDGTRSVCVRFIDGLGNFSTATASITAAIPPSTPTWSGNISRPNGGSEKGTVTYLTWVKSTDNVAVASYRIERRVNPSGSFAQVPGGTVAHNGCGTSTCTFTDSGLIKHTSYGYRIIAVDTSGNVSAYSAIASA